MRGGEAGARAGASGEAGAGGAGAGGASPCTFEVTSSISPVISTVGIVEWSSDFAETETARIEFGLGVTYGMVAPVEPAELAERSHRTLLLGMKSSRVYHFRIVAESSSGACASEDFTLETGPLPSDLPAVSLVDHAPGTPVGGFLRRWFPFGWPRFHPRRRRRHRVVVRLRRNGPCVRMSHAGNHLWFSGVNVAGGECVDETRDDGRARRRRFFRRIRRAASRFYGAARRDDRVHPARRRARSRGRARAGRHAHDDFQRLERARRFDAKPCELDSLPCPTTTPTPSRT